MSFFWYFESYRLSLIFFFFMLFTEVYGIKTKPVGSFSEFEIPFLDINIFIEDDSAIVKCQENLRKHMAAEDTLHTIESLNKLSEIYCNRANYGKAYDGYWRALLLGKKAGSDISMSISYKGLGVLYNFYERKEEAVKYYLKALNVTRQLVEEGKLGKVALIKNYYPLAIHYRYDNDIVTARKYLDSCRLVADSNEMDSVFIDAEYAFLLISEGRFADSEKLLHQVTPILKLRSPSYQVILSSLTGDLYAAWDRPKESLWHYKQALEAAAFHKAHLNFVPDIYKKVSELLFSINRPAEAYRSLSMASDINQVLYSSRSPRNRYLLEIKDEVRLENERREKLIREKRLAKLEHEESIWFLKSAMLLVIIFFLLAIGLFVYRYVRAKHNAEKQIIAQKREMERQKSKEILAIKNKELTASTLRLIAKDELLSKVKGDLKALKNDGLSKDLDRIVKSINLNAEQNWLEFESSFMAVNDQFYDNLRGRFPDLNPYDLKICALIKLNFTGKEMSRLLGISPESAQTSRYRLRKKLGIEKGVNLVDFISSI